jgi:hypothetical protein
MIEKIFKERIPAETIRSRVRYMKKKDGATPPPGEITTPPVTQPNYSEIQIKQEYQKVAPKSTAGPGRRPKYDPAEPYTDAVNLVPYPYIGPKKALLARCGALMLRSRGF